MLVNFCILVRDNCNVILQKVLLGSILLNSCEHPFCLFDCLFVCLNGTFTRIMGAYKVPREQWTYYMALQLTGRAQQAFAALSTADII